MIFDDVISRDEANIIENWFLYHGFPWYYNDVTVSPNSKFDTVAFDHPQFVHLFVKTENGIVTQNSEMTEYPLRLFRKFLSYMDLKEATLLRCKANLQMSVPNEERKYNIPHRDLDEEHYVLLYYVNDSDGDTFLFDNKFNITHTISPKKGRFVLFNGETYHAGRHPIESHTRILLNYDFKLPPGEKI